MADGVNRPAWVDLSSSDPAASRAFYASVFGWEIEVSPDPQYGPQAFPGGRFAIVGDPQGAIFGLMQRSAGG